VPRPYSAPRGISLSYFFPQLGPTNETNITKSKFIWKQIESMANGPAITIPPARNKNENESPFIQ